MKILFVTSNRVGDAVLSTGLLHYLIDRNPKAEVTVACGPNAAPLFREVPNVQHIVVFRKLSQSAHWIVLWSRVVGTFWDLVVDLRSSALSFLIISRKRHVFRKPQTPVHQVEALAKVLGVSPAPAPRIMFGQEHEVLAKELLPEGSPILALAPTANWGGKQWPAMRFSELVERLTKLGGRLAGARVAIFGAAGEREMVASLLDSLPREQQIDLVGNTDLLTAYTCLKRCCGFIGNDSGLMHLAAASGIPTLGLFGPSQEKIYAPWGQNCSWVRTKRAFRQIVDSPDYNFRSQKSQMDDLPVDWVEASFIEVLQKFKAAP